eukprot:6213679-Pleurochrysis_carterae.AAC.2
MVMPTRREMPALLSKHVPNGKQPAVPTQPRKSKALVAYDFALDELLARLVEHSSTAREAIYDTDHSLMGLQAANVVVRADAHHYRYNRRACLP